MARTASEISITVFLGSLLPDNIVKIGPKFYLIRFARKRAKYPGPNDQIS